MILTDIKILLGIPKADCTKDELLMYLSRIVRRKIVNYCNIREIPESHEHILAEMVAEYYKQTGIVSSETSSPVSIQSNGGRVVKKETIGDYSIEYETSTSSGTSSAVKTVDTILQDYRAELNQIRKLRL